jgi:Heparinase II/III-like protein/Heparinase II/III N-terminus
MVPRVRQRFITRPARRRTRAWVARICFEAVAFVVVSAIFLLKIANYADPAALRPAAIGQAVATVVGSAVSRLQDLGVLGHCPSGFRKNDVTGGYVCVRGPERGPYARIYGSYPLAGGGRESIYASTDSGSIAAADALLHDRVDLPRYRAVRLRALPTWSENPYSASYWRLEFYSLRPTLNLLYAYRVTGQDAYAGRLRQLDSSFIAAESGSRWAWADPHAVALRSMALVDTWWTLRQDHQLPEGASTAILEELEKTGRFLADRHHYNPGENFSITEAAALYELAVAFGDLPGAAAWLALAKGRFRRQLASAVDADGQLAGSSAYDDISALDEYWQIYEYMLARHRPISANFGARLRSMLTFATYLIQPDRQIPLLGASPQTAIQADGVYASMAAADPNFRYLLTGGAHGSRPPADSVFFRAAALTIMRSGWGRGAAASRSTYLTYDGGRPKAGPGDLDALDVTLYGDGGDLLADPGPYTDTRGRYYGYFHGARSRNTVVVDSGSRAPGRGMAAPLVARDGFTYQSAESSPDPGVTHRRLVMMIDADHVLVVDQLSSAIAHTYRQLFHLFAGASLEKSGLTVSGIGGTPRREITIQQLLPDGITENDTIGGKSRGAVGVCSQEFGEPLPCHAISYSANRKDAVFATLLTIGTPGPPGPAIRVSDGGGCISVTDGQRSLSVALGGDGRSGRGGYSAPGCPAGAQVKR